MCRITKRLKEGFAAYYGQCHHLEVMMQGVEGFEARERSRGNAHL